MRTTTDLVSVPYAFTQNALLTPSDFVGEARKRGVSLIEQQLEGFHQARLLVPLIEVKRDGQAIRAAARQSQHEARQMAHQQPTTLPYLRSFHRAGWLRDPVGERFVPRRRLLRSVGDWHYEASSFLYSPHQLITLPLLRQTLPDFIGRRHGDDSRDIDWTFRPRAWLKERWLEQAPRLREIVIAVTALEPIYLPQIIGRLSLPSTSDFGPYEEWRRTLPVTRTARWLRLPPRWFREAGGFLLDEVNRFDPLGPWAELIAEADPEKWASLHGEARNAIDLRLAAEILLRYDDDLLAAGKVKPPSASPFRQRGTIALRLKRRRPLDVLLTEFGLSPHPRLILVVEGETERLLFPRVMEALGISTEEDFIAVENAEGADRDLSPLIAYAAAPRVEEADHAAYLTLRRPPTRILVVLDTEGQFATAELRERHRQAWIDRLMRTLPRERRNSAYIREQIATLVEATTWKRTGESFEFAHFTDHQLATAIDHLDHRTRRPTLARRSELVAERRRRRASLDPLLHHTSKVDLADELWPLLERRIANANDQSLQRIPMVRIIRRAVEIAQEFPRRNIVLALEPPTRGLM